MLDPVSRPNYSTQLFDPATCAKRAPAAGAGVEATPAAYGPASSSSEELHPSRESGVFGSMRQVIEQPPWANTPEGYSNTCSNQIER